MEKIGRHKLAVDPSKSRTSTCYSCGRLRKRGQSDLSDQESSSDSFKANKLDKPFLNQCIKFYDELAIYGDEVATEKFANDDTQSLRVEEDAEDFDGGAGLDIGTPSKVGGPWTKHRACLFPKDLEENERGAICTSKR